MCLGGLHTTSLPREAALHADTIFIGPGEDKRVTSESGEGKTREGNVTISGNVFSDVRTSSTVGLREAIASLRAGEKSLASSMRTVI